PRALTSTLFPYTTLFRSWNQKEDRRDQTVAARWRADRADLRPQRFDQTRDQHTSRKADRGEHCRSARLHHFPLARPLLAGRDHYAAHRHYSFVPPDVVEIGRASW